MPITVDWPNKVVEIPRNDMPLVQSNPIEIRSLDLQQLHLTLRALEAGDGIDYPHTHDYVLPFDVGGTSLAPVLAMINDYTVRFEDGQYAVNLIGANSNVGDVVNINQVSVRSSNSAGLTFSEQINAQSFVEQAISIDANDGFPGTAFPTGTPTRPVDNLADAVSIANFRGLNKFYVDGDLTLDVATNQPATWVGFGAIRTRLVLSAGVSVASHEFDEARLSGVQNGLAVYRDCRLDGISGFDGVARDCFIFGPITAAANATLVGLYNCTSIIPGGSRPVLDLSLSDCNAQVRNWTGGLTLTGLNTPRDVSIDVNSGTVEIDST